MKDLSNCPTFKYGLLIGDLVYLSISYFLSLQLIATDDLPGPITRPLNSGYVFAGYIAFLSLFVFIFVQNDLYKPQSFRSVSRHLRMLAKAILLGTAIVALGLLLVAWQFFWNHGRAFPVILLVVSILLAAIFRPAMVRMLLRPGAENGKKRRLLVVGGGDAARKAATAIQNDPTSFLTIVGFADDYRAPGVLLFDHWVNLGRLEAIPEITRTLQPDEILIAIDQAPYPRLEKIVDACLQTGCVVRVCSDRLATLASRIGADEYAPGVSVINLAQTHPGPLRQKAYRVFDIVMALLALIVLSPLLVAVCMGIKVSSRGPVIYRQTRVGMNGRPFNIYKFRSMHVGVSSERHEEYVKNFIRGQVPNRPEDDPAPTIFKIADDPRTFAFGRFIRRTSIDEFPQLLNVLKGDMSLISPRPCLPYEWEAYEDWHKQRLSVSPGCTGLWQVYGRSSVPFEEMVIMDLYYISNRSVILDARILYKTVAVILFGRGGF